MQHLEASGAVRHIYMSLGGQRLILTARRSKYLVLLSRDSLQIISHSCHCERRWKWGFIVKQSQSLIQNLVLLH